MCWLRWFLYGGRVSCGMAACVWAAAVELRRLMFSGVCGFGYGGVEEGGGDVGDIVSVMLF